MFETCWRNNFIEPRGDNPTLADLIAALEAAVTELKQMHAAGVFLHAAADDYYFLRTDSAAVADRFGFDPAEDEDEDDDEED
jgi:hypothetical protein